MIHIREFEVLETNSSASNPAVTHEIRRGGDGIIYCTCPAWRFRRTCRHLDNYLIRSGEGISRASLISSSEWIMPQGEAETRGPLKKWQVYTNGVQIGAVSGYSKADVLAKLVSYHGKKDKIEVKAG